MDRENAIEEQNKITFDLTYYPIFQNLKKKIFTELHLLLIFDVAHKTFFKNMQIITFKNDTSLKGQLFWALLPKVDAEGRSKPFGKKKRPCEVCNSVNGTFHFKKRDTDENFNMLKGPLDCNSKHAIYFTWM